MWAATLGGAKRFEEDPFKPASVSGFPPPSSSFPSTFQMSDKLTPVTKIYREYVYRFSVHLWIWLTLTVPLADKWLAYVLVMPYGIPCFINSRKQYLNICNL